MPRTIFSFALYESNCGPNTEATYEVRFGRLGDTLEVRVEPSEPGSRAKRYCVLLHPTVVMEMARFLWGTAKDLGAK